MNTETLILSATGRPVYAVGLHSWAKFSEGDYIVSLEWDTGEDCEPVMCIWSKYGGRNAGVFGICLSSIAKYADPSGNPTKACFLECLRALPILGRAQLDIEVHKLVDIVLRHTPDLIRMPPVPVQVRRDESGPALLEMTLQDEAGKRLSEDVI